MKSLSNNTDSVLRPLVSVVICTYNGEYFLEQTLESVYRQTYGNVEILVVDDGSTDSTREILAKAQKQNKRVRIILQENKGLANARNRAFNNAAGDWIAVIDQDDICYPERIEKQLDNALRNKDAGLIFCNTDYINEKGKIIGKHMDGFSLRSKYLKKVEAANLLLKLGCFVDSESLFIKKTLVNCIGSLDESLSYACDYEYFVRAGFISDFSYIDEVLAAWRIHPAQATRKNLRQDQEIIGVYKRAIFHRKLWLSMRLYLIFKVLARELALFKKTIRHHPLLSFVKKG